MELAAPPAGAARRGRVATRIALVTALAHGLNDAYASVVPPLLPRIMDRLGLSIALAATIAVTFSISSSLLQPLLGYVADHYDRRLFLVGGPLVSGVFVSLIGFAPGFWALVLLLTLGGLGSAAFHPPGASYAARVSEGKGSGTRLSVFSFGGAAGFAVGPLFAVCSCRAAASRASGSRWYPSCSRRRSSTSASRARASRSVRRRGRRGRGRC